MDKHVELYDGMGCRQNNNLMIYLAKQKRCRIADLSVKENQKKYVAPVIGTLIRIIF